MNTVMKQYVVVSFSGGKDSTAMLLHMLELGEHIDEVVFCDTYKEFPAMYEHVEKVRQIVESASVLFTTLRNPNSFDYYMFEYQPKRRNQVEFDRKYPGVKGKSWATPTRRWCTGELKIKIVDKYFKNLRNAHNVIQCVGIAIDETKRLERKNQSYDGKRYPLVEWNWTEADCLKFCYDRGFDWGGVYEQFHRVSCWCCPLQPLDSLRSLRRNYPDLWEELKEMDKRTWVMFHSDASVNDIDIRFAFEDERLANSMPIQGKYFRAELNRRIKNSHANSL